MKDRVAFPDLRNGKLRGPDSGLEGAILKTVAVTIPIHAALVWSGSDISFAFE